MKKSLVLAMAMALGVTASAYAANPFSDVSAGHWAYDSINKLAAAGVIEGYGDATFGGDKLMTRYEMAQIVAKAMAKGVNVDKLAAEFADELDNLGVRVTNLEKKADNVKISGQIRASYKDADKAGSESRLRTRLILNGAVNDDWTYVARLENNQYFSDRINGTRTGNSGEEDTDFNWAYVDGRIGVVNVTAGRQDFVYGDTMDTRGDGVKLSYGKEVKLTGYALKAASAGRVGTLNADDRVYVADLGTKIGVVNANARYFKGDTDRDSEIYEAAFALPVVKNLNLSASYFNGDDSNNGDSNGYLVGVSYKGAKASAPGSWGLYAKYSDRPLATYLEPTAFAGYAEYPATANTADGDGYKGYEAGINYTLAKNIVAGVKYFDFEARNNDNKESTLWSEVVFTF